MMHQHLRRLSGIFGYQLVVVNGQPNFVHLSGLSKPRKVDEVLYAEQSLNLLELLGQGCWFERCAVHVAQQPVIVIAFYEGFLVAPDRFHALFDFSEERLGKYCLRVLPSFFGPFRIRLLFISFTLLGNIRMRERVVPTLREAAAELAKARYTNAEQTAAAIPRF